MLSIAAAAAVFGVFAFIHRISFESDLIDNGVLGVDDVLDKRDTADGLVGGAVALMGFVSLVIFILFIIWTYRAMKNNEALGRRQRFSPGWGIGAWFIPLANLIIVPMIFWDLWKGSDASVPPGQSAENASGSPLVIFWWLAHIVGGARFGGFGGEAHLDRPDELEDLRTSDTVAAVGNAVTIVAAVLAIMVLRGIARRQEECAQLRGGVPTG
jgi:membrane protease YdiL (CAAX protease family)